MQRETKLSCNFNWDANNQANIFNISASWSGNWICLAWPMKRPNTSGRWSNETLTSARKKRRDWGRTSIRPPIIHPSIHQSSIIYPPTNHPSTHQSSIIHPPIIHCHPSTHQSSTHPSTHQSSIHPSTHWSSTHPSILIFLFFPLTTKVDNIS